MAWGTGEMALRLWSGKSASKKKERPMEWQPSVVPLYVCQPSHINSFKAHTRRKDCKVRGGGESFLVATHIGFIPQVVVSKWSSYRSCLGAWHCRRFNSTVGVFITRSCVGKGIRTADSNVVPSVAPSTLRRSARRHVNARTRPPYFWGGH